MRNSKHGLKALALAMMAAALGTMAFVASAQAQTHTETLHALTLHAATLNPNPLTNGGTLGEFKIGLGAALLAAIAAEQLGEGELLVAARDLVIKCKELHLGAGSHINNSTDAKVVVEFLGCLAFSHSTLAHLTGCVTKELGTIKASALALPILHGGQLFVLFEPLEGTQFAVVSFKPNVGCVLPLNNPVTGAVVARVDQLEAVVQLLLFDEAIQLLNGDVLKYGGLANTAYLKGHVNVALTGAPHENLKLGVH